MNDIQMKQLEQTLTSMEVSEMVGKNHKELMRDIRRYCNQISKANEELEGERKIALSDFFKESTYKNSQNKTQPCFDITKKGCEFIAHGFHSSIHQSLSRHGTGSEKSAG